MRPPAAAQCVAFVLVGRGEEVRATVEVEIDVLQRKAVRPGRDGSQEDRQIEQLGP